MKPYLITEITSCWCHLSNDYLGCPAHIDIFNKIVPLQIFIPSTYNVIQLIIKELDL